MTELSNTLANRRPADIEIGGATHRNLFIEPTGARSGTTVLVLPDWLGRTPSQEEFGERLAAQGHNAICVDVYGEGRSASDGTEAEALMMPLVQDRSALNMLLRELVDQLRKFPAIRSDRMAVIGFCFGGLCALDLARSGMHFELVASFHGVLDPPVGLPASPINSRVVCFHGWDDPIAPSTSIVGLAHELDQVGADWELHCFGKARHAFMMKDAALPDAGIVYDEAASGRSWQILLSMLEGKRELA